MGDNNKDFTLEDILEEQRKQREGLQEDKQLSFDRPEPQGTVPDGERAAKSEKNTVREQEDAEDISRYATGTVELPRAEKTAGYETAGQADKKKKKKGGLFGRKKKKAPVFDESDDMYYGVQLKPIDEYRKGYNSVTGEFSMGEDGYAALFDDSKKAIDDEVEKNFQRLQKERRSRVAEAVQSAGMDESEIENELGIIAPMPVSSYSADPYAKQHGIGVEGADPDEDMTDFHKAQMKSIEKNEQTMEIKLNVLNDTIELKKVQGGPVGEESIGKILADAPSADVPEDAEEMISTEEAPREAEYLPESDTEGPGLPGGGAEKEPDTAATQVAPAVGKQADVIKGREPQEIPRVASIYEYRTRGITTHVINADVLQGALLSEAEEIERKAEKKKRPALRKPHAGEIEEYENPREDGPQESIDDYTGPEDAKSIANELKADMHDLTLRMMITGISTVVLAVINLIFSGTFSSATDLGASPVIYVVLTLVFLGAAVAVCFRTVANGLRALLSFNANSDSAIAVAAVGVIVQTIASLFFTEDIVKGNLHLYAAVFTAVLFVNIIGKLTMIRRIHSNFRFITSREQKYAVKIYDDYNTALKMTKDSVAEKPVLAYQEKTAFLKRFLEFSYRPDPAETSSQALAPIGLIASLVLCVACMLITGSVPAAVSALAAALIASVAVTNMLAVNLPMSRVAKMARRAGAMVVGYEGIKEAGNVNAVMVDADDLFPRGTVVLNGIKTYGDRGTLEDSIMAASALVNEVGGPLTGVFEQVISENEDALPEVENFTYEDGNGITGRVDGKRIYIGNRNLLVNHRLEPPAREDETQYSNANKQIIYIGVDAEVVAMMILTYSADRRRRNEIQRMEDNGVSLIVRTTDANITPQLVARLFGIDTASVSVLDNALGDVYHNLVKTETPRSDALIATKGRVESMMSVISAAVSGKRGINLIVALQTAAVILGFILVAFLACFNALQQLSSFGLFLFEMIWILVILGIPRLRKP